MGVHPRHDHQTFLPGLLQIPDYTRARTAGGTTIDPSPFTADGVLAGRAGRQRMRRRPGAPAYEVILDELAVRRLTAPPDIFKKQLRHLTTVCNNGEPAVTLRVLPVDARIDGFSVPRCTFSMYTYPDPGDPAVVAADTVTSDLIVTQPAEVAPYEQLYTRLRDAALPPADSLTLLSTTATQLPSYPATQPIRPASPVTVGVSCLGAVSAERRLSPLEGSGGDDVGRLGLVVCGRSDR